jgi:YYY domain-containing protein
MMGAKESGVPSSKAILPQDMGRQAAFAGLLIVVALALALRFYGINWDQGFAWTPHPDERAILMKVDALAPPALGDLGVLLDADESPWNPRWFPYGSFPLYLLKGVQLTYGLLPGPDITDLRIAGRTISALADVATVVVVFAVGSTVYSRRVGLLAAALVSLAVIHIQLSHFFAVDTLMALFAVLSMYFLIRVAREGRLRDSGLAGLFVGLGLATKISMAPILGAFAVAHLVFALGLVNGGPGRSTFLTVRVQTAAGGLLFGGLAAALAFLIAQPYTILDWGRFYGDFIEQSEMVRRIRDYPYTRQYVDTTPYLYQVRQLATWGLGWPVGVLAWSGTLFVSVRGMRPAHGLVYLGVGWALPMAVLLMSNTFAGMLVSATIALSALVASLPLRRDDTRMDVLLLAWVAPYFLITGSFEVKFLRYMIPIAPFLLLFGAKLALSLWELAQRRRGTPLGVIARPIVVAMFALVLGGSAFYGVSYLGVYNDTHPAVAASNWINGNVREGSLILKEHWDEGLPNMSHYRVSELPLYDPDTPGKLSIIAGELSRADYLVLFSNRLYGTIPRLGERYPVSQEYYRLLFTGQLGYELEEQFASYPELLGVSFVDETFSRPDLPDPAALARADGPAVPLNLGFADESFSVYDHPKVLVFRNALGLGPEAISAKILDSSAGFTRQSFEPRQADPEPDSGIGGLLLSPEEASVREAGGTWTRIVRSESWTNRLPVLAWLAVVEGFALLAFPLAFVVFRPLPDRGWLFSKALGLLLVGLVVWLLASLQWMTFSRGSVLAGAIVVLVPSLGVLFAQRVAIKSFVARNWRIIAIGEALFLVAFLAFLAIRAANPDLWHPFRGGEKPMDFAYLNAVLRSSYMPPYDPWFAGGYINYYYWGQFLVATLVHATGIQPAVAVNLAVPLFFALTAGAAFSLVYNLAEGTRLRLGQRSAPDARLGAERFHWSPVLAGVAGLMFVAVLGNLDGAIQVGQGAWRSLVQGLPLGEFDFWRSSRMMAPDPPGHEITEFPFFTFLFADLHAHLMALPFTLLALGLTAAVVVRRAVGPGREDGGGFAEIARLAVLGLTVGALRLLNAWDYPTYLAIAAGSVALAELLAHGGVGLSMAWRTGLKVGLVFAVGYLAFLPYHLNYETFFNSVESTTNTTVLWQFLAISGLFVFVIGSYYLLALRGSLAELGGRTRHLALSVVDSVSADGGRVRVAGSSQVGVGLVLALVGSGLVGVYLLTGIASGVVGGAIVFAVLALAGVIVVGYRAVSRVQADSAFVGFVSLLIAVAFSLVLGLDFLRVEGDIDRMNSVFKFYLQVWVLMAVGAAYLLWRLLYRRSLGAGSRWRGMRRAWAVVLVALVVSAAVYPVLGTRDRLRDRFDGDTTPLTLSGEAFIAGATYRDAKGVVDLAADFQGIEWLRQNVQGSPVVLEANTPTYRWGGRVSIYTGLPSVVGWQWHQEQQRWGYREDVGRRIRDVSTIYRTEDTRQAISLLARYNVRYVYLGQLERLYYPGPGIEKFAGALAEYLEPVFTSEAVTIYRVRDERL